MTETDMNATDSKIPITDNNVHIEGLKDEDKVEIKKNPRVKHALTRTMVVNKKIEYSLDDLGKIENAKKHKSANRPLHKIKDFTDYVNFCRCCNLPCEEKGIIEPFKCCDDIDNFSECGLGVTLYFYFIQFMTLILFMGICILSISIIIFNHNYTDGIFDVCDDLYDNSTGNVNVTNVKYCRGFIKNSNIDTNYYQKFSRWILRISSDNIEVYRKIHKYINLKPEDNVEDVVVNYSILNFCFLITSFIINIFFIVFIKAQAQKARILNFSIRDYTALISEGRPILDTYIDRQKSENKNIMFRGSQIQIENGKEFKTYVNDYIRGHKELMDIEINNINLCYDLGNYMEFRDEYEECKRKIFQIEHNIHNIEINDKKKLLGDERLYYNFCLSIIGLYCCHTTKEKDNFKTLKKQKADLEKQLDSEQQNVTQYVTEKNFTGYMLVSFNTIKSKELFLSQYPHNFFGMIYNYLKHIDYYLFCCCVSKDDRKRFRQAKGLDAYDPPEPEDIIWENFNITENQRKLRTLGVFCICLLIMAFSLGCVFVLTLLQEILYKDDKEQGNTNIFLKYLVSLAITVVISVINAILQEFLEKLTHKEKQISRSNYILSLSIKITIFTFFNSAIIPLISKYIVIIMKEKDEDKGKDYYSRSRERDNLIIDDMLVYFIVNAIVTPLLWTLSFPYLLKLLRQCCIERGDNPDKNHYMTQRDLNTLYENPDMNLAYKYSYIAKTTAMCLFFMPIFPLGFIFGFIGFIFAYYLEKFNFTHLYKRPEMLDEIITTVYTEFFIVILFIGGIGDYIFLYDIFDNNKWSLSNIIVFGILIIIPYTKFFECNFVGIDKSQYLNYPLSKVYFTFYNDYQRQNPLTKRIGLLNYLTELKKYDYLSDYAYKIAQENIEQLNIMEIYYGISRGSIPLAHQSIIANTNNSSILSQGNLVKSILGRGLLKTTIVRPDIEDNPEIRKKKKKFYDSQILNMFGKGNKEGDKKGNYESIKEDNESEENDNETKDQLVDAYNNPLGINIGLGPLPLTTSIYKDQDNSSNKNIKNE